MGGGGHGHHHMKIPDYKIYKVEDVPELMAVRRSLAAHGLKDPWLRNEVWKYSKQQGTFGNIFKRTIGRGFKWGALAGVITAGIEWGFRMKDDHGHGHGEEHGHH